MRRLLDEFEKIACAVLLLAMTALGFGNILVRYGTHYSFAASEELLTSGFVLLTIFGAAIAARRGEHLAVELVGNLLPRPARRVLFWLTTLLALALLASSAWFCWRLVLNQYATGTRSYGLGVPMWWYTVATPLGFALILIRYLQHALTQRGT